jgi:RNA polymerase sigma-70 factor (ECF subfamily)
LSIANSEERAKAGDTQQSAKHRPQSARRSSRVVTVRSSSGAPIGIVLEDDPDPLGGRAAVPDITIAAVDEWTRLALAARSSRDRHALESFVRATQDDVWRLCAHLGDRDRADDLVQETYVRVLRSLPLFRGDAPVRSWLFSIVRRVAADDIAARQRGRRHLSDVDHGSVRRVASPDHQGSVTLEHLLGTLDPDRRAAFVLTQLLGYSYAEAAETCHVPIGTIRSRVARARESLITLLGEPALVG